MTFEGDKDHNYYTSIYRHDTARWGGKTHMVPDTLPRNMDITQLASTNRSIKRVVQSYDASMNSVSRTPYSTTRSTFVNHFPRTRSIAGPTFSPRAPHGIQPPSLGDEALFRPTTEYGSRYTPKFAEPFVNDTTKNRCKHPDNSFDSRDCTTQSGNRWESTYRDRVCNGRTDLHTSQAVTFRTFTGNR